MPARAPPEGLCRSARRSLARVAAQRLPPAVCSRRGLAAPGSRLANLARGTEATCAIDASLTGASESSVSRASAAAGEQSVGWYYTIAAGKLVREMVDDIGVARGHLPQDLVLGGRERRVVGMGAAISPIRRGAAPNVLDMFRQTAAAYSAGTGAGRAGFAAAGKRRAAANVPSPIAANAAKRGLNPVACGWR